MMADRPGTHLLLGRPDVTADRALARALISDLRRPWRRHGIGCIQSYVSEGGPSEVRVHVWHPTLKKPGIADHGDVHDHRFSLLSTVLHGAVRHEEYHVEEDPDGEWDVLQVMHARANPSGEFAAEPMRVVPGPLARTAKRVRADVTSHLFSCGQTYSFARGYFHRSIVDELTVTLVTKCHQIDAGARILSKHGEIPVEAFDPSDADDGELACTILRVLDEAANALDDSARPGALDGR